MNLIDKDRAVAALKTRVETSGGAERTAMTRALNIIENFPAIVDVIDVKEEKKETVEWKTGRPRGKGPYLCYMEVASEGWCEVCKYIGKDEWASLTGEIATTAVKAWMELPEAP